MKARAPWLSGAVLVLLAGLCAQAANPGLKWLSAWELEAAQPSDVKGWANFLFTCSDPAVLQRFSDAGIGPHLINVEGLLFTATATGTIELVGGYEQVWQQYLETTIRPLMQKGTVMGVFLGDELCWNCLSYANLSAVVALARSTLPKPAIIYYNEAYPVFTQSKCSTGDPLPYPSVPAGLDWVSIDYYPDEGTFQGARSLFQNHLYPRMAPHQSALFVPPAYGAGNATVSERLCCSQKTPDGPNPECNANCTLAMLQWADASYAWAQEDERLIGMTPWHYDGAAVPDALFQPGLIGMPAVLSRWKQIGREILSKQPASSGP